jgi:hypothetical protein
MQDQPYAFQQAAFVTHPVVLGSVLKVARGGRLPRSYQPVGQISKRRLILDLYGLNAWGTLAMALRAALICFVNYIVCKDLEW